MAGLIDLHCHILPGIDDGASTLEDSIDMANKAVSQGITHILCTPHENNGRFNNPKASVIKRVDALQKELDERKIPLQLLAGQEVHITGELMQNIKDDQILFVDLQDQYLLIEFPSSGVPEYTDTLFSELISSGITPVIVHPERNAHFIKDPNNLISFLDLGCMAQLTAPSYIGVFGDTIQNTAHTMVEHNMVQCVASDAHGIHKRNFYLKEALDAIAKDFGKDRAVAMNQFARDLVNGAPVSSGDYTPVDNKKHHWWNIF